MLASLFLIGATFATPQMSVQAASQMIVEDGAGGMTGAVNRMIGGIISYVTWPDRAQATPLTLCRIGTPRLAENIAPAVPGIPSVTVRRTTAGNAIAKGDCDILFLGRMPVADRSRLIEWVHRRAVLTLTDDDPSCLYGAMFCLAGGPAGLSFAVNLDAIARGPLRVDPRVLKIGAAP